MSIDKELAFIPGPHGRLASLAVNFHPDNRARIILAHGFSASATMAESSKLFIQTAESLAEQGIGSLLFDFTGNGISDGLFRDMTPNRRITELLSLIDHVSRAYDGKLFLLGFSMGGAISIYAAGARETRLSGLVTWSSVPSFDLDVPSAHWFPKNPSINASDSPGPEFYTDRPQRSIAETYTGLRLPKLQIQGDKDKAFFAEEFRTFFNQATDPKELVILPEGDHVFTACDIRRQVIEKTTDWIDALC